MNSAVPTPNNSEAATMPRRGYRIMEAAQYMGVSPWFVELKIRSGELPALRLCRHYTVMKEDMDKFLDDQKRAAVQARRAEYLEQQASQTGLLTSDAPPDHGRRPRKGKRQRKQAAA